MPVRLVLLAGLLAVTAGCAEPEPPTASVLTPGPSVRAPGQVQTADGTVELASLQGRPVVIQFAPRDDAQAWAALADALADLEAAGATVLSVTVDGAEEQARAFGYDGVPIAVVVDGEGAIRGRARPESGDALFALASPVLAEADVMGTVAWTGADTLDELIEAGGVVVAEHPVDGVDAVLKIDADLFAAQDLPADLGTPLAFVGDRAAKHAERAAGWGYVAAFVADGQGVLSAVEAQLPSGMEPRSGQGSARRGVRG